jgi:hypothetical protein
VLRPSTDTLFELGDVLLTTGEVPSPVYLSLQPSHRRSWSSIYAALDHGKIDEEAEHGLFSYI